MEIKSWDDLQKEFEQLEFIIKEKLSEEKSEHNKSIIAFESRVENLIKMGAGDRETALRWIHGAEDTKGNDEYLCFSLGLPYGYFKVQKVA